MKLFPTNETEVIETFKDCKFLFISAISFENRSISICETLIKNGLRPYQSILVDYNSKAYPFEDDIKLRTNNRAYFNKLLGEKGNIRVTPKLNPYSTSSLRKNTNNFLSDENNLIIVDISCFTRAHLLALASVIFKLKHVHKKIFFAYSAPESYNIEKHDRYGWSDILLLPIGYPKSIRREGHARGIVLPGHDAERLSLALSELEPAAGSIIYANTYKRPDIMGRSLEVNSAIRKHLLSLKMPRFSKCKINGDIAGWSENFIFLDDYTALSKIIEKQAEEAEIDQGPLILFPFGPKTLTFAASIFLSCLVNINAWAIYPIPYLYDVEYTERVSKIYWIKF